jgi:hypothetical protein
VKDARRTKLVFDYKKNASVFKKSQHLEFLANGTATVELKHTAMPKMKIEVARFAHSDPSRTDTEVEVTVYRVDKSAHGQELTSNETYLGSNRIRLAENASEAAELVVDEPSCVVKAKVVRG